MSKRTTIYESRFQWNALLEKGIKSKTQFLCEKQSSCVSTLLCLRKWYSLIWNVESFSFEVCFRTSETMFSLFFCKYCFKWKHVYHSCDELYSFLLIVHMYIDMCISIEKFAYSHDILTSKINDSTGKVKCIVDYSLWRKRIFGQPNWAH